MTNTTTEKRIAEKKPMITDEPMNTTTKKTSTERAQERKTRIAEIEAQLQKRHTNNAKKLMTKNEYLTPDIMSMYAWLVDPDFAEKQRKKLTNKSYKAITEGITEIRQEFVTHFGINIEKRKARNPFDKPDFLKA